MYSTWVSFPGRNGADTEAHLCVVIVGYASRVYHKVVSMVYMMILTSMVHLAVSRLVPAERVLVYPAIFQGNRRSSCLNSCTPLPARSFKVKCCCVNARDQEEDGRGRRRQVFCLWEPSRAGLFVRQAAGGRMLVHKCVVVEVRAATAASHSRTWNSDPVV